MTNLQVTGDIIGAMWKSTNTFGEWNLGKSNGSETWSFDRLSG